MPDNTKGSNLILMIYFFPACKHLALSCLKNIGMVAACLILSLPAAAQDTNQTPPQRQTTKNKNEPEKTGHTPPLTLPFKSWPGPQTSKTPGSSVFPEADFGDMVELGTSSVQAIIDPLTLLLSDGRTARLSGIDVPDADPYTPGDIAVKATETLRSLLMDQKIRLYVTPDSRIGRMNRMGHVMTQAERLTDGAWIQGILISQGLVRVRTNAENPQMSEPMLTLERAARDAKTGLWSGSDFSVRTPEEAGDHMDSFQIVEGTIESVSTTRNRIYMNFGKNWKTDFTAGLDPQARMIFSKQGLKPLQWGERRVRVRGWIRKWNGPYMDIESPESIEFLDAGHLDMAPPLQTIAAPVITHPTVPHIQVTQHKTTTPTGGHVTVAPSDFDMFSPHKSSLDPGTPSGLKEPQDVFVTPPEQERVKP